MAKKDEHITSEMRRIQDEYRKIFVKLQNQIGQERRGARAQHYREYDVSDAKMEFRIL